MKPSSKKTTSKNPADEYNQLMDELQDIAQPTHSTQGEDAGCDVSSLKSRAQQLLVWITRHKSHVDRHELSDICKEGMKTIMKIMKATGKTNTTELEIELMVLEARKTACEEAFAEDLKGFDNITPDIINSLPSKVQVSIKTRISKAKSNIYATIDTPEGILNEIRGMHDKVKENLIDDIISQTLDTVSSFSHLRKSPILRDQLKGHIREHIEYTEVKALIKQVNTLLSNRLYVYNLEYSYGQLPHYLTGFIGQYNNSIAELIKLNYNESQKYSRICINDFHPEEWSLDGAESLILFQKFDDKYKEMRTIRDDIFSNIDKLMKKMAKYVWFSQHGDAQIINEKPSHIDMNTFRYYLREISEINYAFERIIRYPSLHGLPHPDDRYLSYYNKKVDDLISRIS